MIKKVLTGTGVIAALAGMFLLGSTLMGPVFAHAPSTPPQTQALVSSTGNATSQETVQGSDQDNVQEQVGDQNQADTQDSPEAGAGAASEQSLDTTDAPAGTAAITTAQAEAAALAANPGTTVVKTTLDNENGTLVYSIELSNGSDVKVDATTAAVLHTETAGQDGQSEVPENSGN